MSNPMNRRGAQRARLRKQLNKKQESLADQFQFKIYTVFHFKDKMKSNAVFETSEAIPVMTNNYEDCILEGARREAYSMESSRQLLDKDIVQIHASKWQAVREDMFGSTVDINFLLWPRGDIESIECRLYSRWKEDDEESFKPLLATFGIDCENFGTQLANIDELERADGRTARTKSTGHIVNNPDQTMFLFVDRQHLLPQKRCSVVFTLSSLCLYLPQDQLTVWSSGTHELVLEPCCAP